MSTKYKFLGNEKEFLTKFFLHLREKTPEEREICYQILLYGHDNWPWIKHLCYPFIWMRPECVPSSVQILVNGDFSPESFEIAKTDILSDFSLWRE